MSIAIRDRVPNQPLRERFLLLQQREGLSLAEVAHRAGLVKDGKVDTSHVARALGMQAWAKSRKNGHTYGGYRSDYMSYPMACRLAEALDLDPWEVGI